jgi:hypothetical protein
MTPPQSQSQAATLPRIGAARPVRDDHNTVARIRPTRRALAMFAGLAILVPVAGAWNARLNQISDSAIPGTEQNLDTTKFKREPIPAEGAFDFAAQEDPNHDPRNGVDRFQHQLGHEPQVGDMVAVPIDAK